MTTHTKHVFARNPCTRQRNKHPAIDNRACA